jgi:hypothetical protein
MKFIFETDDIDEAMRIMAAFKEKAAAKKDEKNAPFPASFTNVSWKVKRSKSAQPKYVRIKGHRLPYKRLLGMEIETFVEENADMPRKDLMEKILERMLPYTPGKEVKRRIKHNIDASFGRLRRKKAKMAKTPTRAKPINTLSEARPEPDREFKESVMKDVGSHWKTGVSKTVIINRIMAILNVNEEVATNQYLLLRREGVLMENPDGKVKKVLIYSKRKKRNAPVERMIETAAEV